MYAGGGVHAAVAAAARRRVIEAFRAAGATTGTAAKTPEDAGVGERMMIRRLVRRGILVEKSGGRYWLDEKALEEHEARAKKTALILSGALAFGMMMLLLVLVTRKG